MFTELSMVWEDLFCFVKAFISRSVNSSLKIHVHTDISIDVGLGIWRKGRQHEELDPQIVWLYAGKHNNFWNLRWEVQAVHAPLTPGSILARLEVPRSGLSAPNLGFNSLPPSFFLLSFLPLFFFSSFFFLCPDDEQGSLKGPVIVF